MNLKEEVLEHCRHPLNSLQMVSKNAHCHLDITSIPMWVDLIGILGSLFSIQGISYLAGGVLGKPIRLQSTEKCNRLDVARVLVEVDLHKPLHKFIKAKGQGTNIHSISVRYPWLPPKCIECSKWGHNSKDCNSTNVGVTPPANIKNRPAAPQQQSPKHRKHTKNKNDKNTVIPLLKEPAPVSATLEASEHMDHGETNLSKEPSSSDTSTTEWKIIQGSSKKEQGTKKQIQMSEI